MIIQYDFVINEKELLVSASLFIIIMLFYDVRNTTFSVDLCSDLQPCCFLTLSRTGHGGMSNVYVYIHDTTNLINHVHATSMSPKMT